MTAALDRRWFVVLGIVCAAGAAFGCGSKQSASPGAPSAAISPTLPVPGAAAGATITGTVVGVSTPSQWTAHAANLSVSVTGTSSTSMVDSSGRFLLQNVPAGHVDLHFSGPATDAHLGLDDVAEHALINITVRVTGSSAQLDNDNREGPNNEAQVEGLVTGKGSSTLTVNGKTIEVTASTQIVHGDTVMTYSSIAVGDRVHVKGTLNGSTVLARKIEVQHQATGPADDDNDADKDDDDADDDHGGDHAPAIGARAELSGTVAGLSGGCPTLTFTVSGTTVKTNGSTEFKDTTCAGLSAGNTVEVKGTRQADNSVLASRVEKKK